MLLGAGPWYSSAALSAILSAAAVLIAVVIGVLSIWLLRIPLRRLLVYTIEAKPLLAARSVDPEEFQVIYRGTQLPDPYLVSFSIVSRSRIDISGYDFFREQPLVFDLRTPIALLNATVPERQGHASDWFNIEGSEIRIGPAVIRRGQTISLNLLTNGAPELWYRNPIAGVRLREEKRGQAAAGLRGTNALLGVANPLLGVLFWVTLLATNVTAGLLSHYLTAVGQPPPTADMAFTSPQPGKPAELQSTPLMLNDLASGGIHSVAYSPDGKYVASGDTNGHFYVWSAATGTLIQNIGDPSSIGVYAVAFSQDGSYFATGDGNGNVYLWSREFALVATLPTSNSGGVRAVAFSQDNKILAAGGSNGMVYLWKVATHQSAGPPVGDPSSLGIYAIAFRPDSSYFAAGDGNGHVYLWAHTLRKDLPDRDSGGIRALAFSKDGKYLAAGDANGFTYVISTTTYNVISSPALPRATYGVNAVAFSPDGKYLAVGDANGHLYLWSDLLTSNPRLIVESASSDFAATGSIAAVAFSSNGTQLAAGTSTGHLYQWSAQF